MPPAAVVPVYSHGGGRGGGLQIDTVLASSRQKNYELALVKLNCRALAVKEPSLGGDFQIQSSLL